MKKLSKITLQSYFDGELSEAESLKIRDFLLEDERSSKELSEMHLLDREVLKERDVTPSSDTSKKILNDVFSVMDKKILKKETRSIANKKEKLKGIVNNLYDLMPSFSIEQGYSLASVAALTVCVIYLSRGEVIPMSDKAFEDGPVVYTTDLGSENGELENIETDGDEL